VIGPDGKNLGVLDLAEAGRMAQEQGLDLIEISPTANPPVCRIMDFGKFKYEREKSEREHGKKQKESELKGIRIGFTTGAHDLALRAEQIAEFLANGDKVRIDMRLRGREKAHGQFALDRFKKFLEIIPVEFTLESPPRRFPQGFIAVLTKKQ